MIKYTRHQLTESSALHFLCRDRKESQNLNHNVNEYVTHSISRCRASIYLKSAEKTSNVVKDVDKIVLATSGDRIFGRLGLVSK